jgi:hypothetical protein
MAEFLDICRFTPVAGGTTDWAVAVAATGYQGPTAAGAVNGVVYRYRAESADLSQWEVGFGAYNSATGVFARTTVLFNSLGTTAKISFSTVPQVAIVALAEDLPSLTKASNAFTGNISVAGTLAVTGVSTLAGALAVSDSTASTSPTTGSGKFAGGLGVGGALSVGGKIVPSTAAGQPHLQTATITNVGASSSVQILGNQAGFIFIREGNTTGDWIIAFLGTFAGISVLASSGLWTLSTTPAANTYSIGFDTGTNTWRIFTGSGVTTRGFSWGVWAVS